MRAAVKRHSAVWLLWALVLLVAAVVPAAGAQAATVTVRLDRTRATTQIGRHFSFVSTVSNPTGSPRAGLVAHLNILSLDPGVYVDPEDWSSHRTRYLGDLPAGSATHTGWTVQAVNSGRFVVYVAVVDRQGTETVSVSGPLDVSVARRRTLNAGGVVPLALGVPVALVLLQLLGVRRRRQRR